MKLEIYEPHKVGEVSLDPYEWTYEGRYQSVVDLLDPKPKLTKGVAVPSNDDEIADGEVEIDGEEFLRELGKELYKRKVWDCLIVEE